MANFKEQFQQFKENKGLYQFALRSLIFFGSIFLIYFAIFLWARHLPFFVQYLRIDDGFYISWLTGLRKTDFLNAGLFAAIGFVVWNRRSLSSVAPTLRNMKQTIIFGVLSLLSFVLHYVHKYWIGQNLELATSMQGFMTFIKYGLLVLFVVFAAIAVYTPAFLKSFWKQYKKTILVFLGVGVAYFFLIQWFQLIWYQLSYFVSVAIRNLLELSFDQVYYYPGNEAIGGPRLGVGTFRVAISNECSGIDSLLLFLSLYSLLFILDYKRMHVKRMWLLFIPGIIMTVAYNILRIYLLMLVGIHIDPQFAVDTFHTNIGWMLFLVFFIIYWHFGSKWVYKKKDELFSVQEVKAPLYKKKDELLSVQEAKNSVVTKKKVVKKTTKKKTATKKAVKRKK